jgi:hypothetical protein
MIIVNEILYDKNEIVFGIEIDIVFDVELQQLALLDPVLLYTDKIGAENAVGLCRQFRTYAKI